MPDTYSQQICPSCGGHQFTKAGSRRLKSGEKRQLYRCVDCNKRFSSRNRTGKNTDPRAILKAVELVCLGHGYEEVLLTLKREYGVTRSKSALSRWISDLPLPWLEIRDGFSIDGPLVRSRLFTHAGLRYLYRVHQGKLRFAKRYTGLVRYLDRLPSFLDATLFDRALHCSALQRYANPGLRHCRDITLTRMAGAAVALAPTARQRHATLQSYFLHGDRATFATEVPVYMRDPELGLVAGHIDALQIYPDKLLLLDYKPRAAAEKPEKVVTQLTLYALALAKRADLPLSEMQCAYFDEHDAYFFDPKEVLREGGCPQPPRYRPKTTGKEATFVTYPADRARR